MATIRKVALAGGSGRLGPGILDQLLQHNFEGYGGKLENTDNALLGIPELTDAELQEAVNEYSDGIYGDNTPAK